MARNSNAGPEYHNDDTSPDFLGGQPWGTKAIPAPTSHTATSHFGLDTIGAGAQGDSPIITHPSVPTVSPTLATGPTTYEHVQDIADGDAGSNMFGDGSIGLHEV